MPQSGDVVMSAMGEKGEPWSLFVYGLKDGKLREMKIRSPCSHQKVALLPLVIIDGQDHLVIFCTKCDDIKLVDLHTREWSTAFTDCKPAALCSGGSGKIFIQSCRGRSILQLDSTGHVFLKVQLKQFTLTCFLYPCATFLL